MNIKTIGPSIQTIDSKGKAEPTKAVKSEASSKDRDANGRREPSENPQKKRLTDEELQEAIAKLMQLSGVKDNDLQVRVEQRGALRFVFIEDRQGQVVRRIPESELWQLTQLPDKKTGQLYDKAG